MEFMQVKDALDTAVAEVAEDEYRRLSRGKSRKGIAKRVARVLRSFEQLQSGMPPKYNKWDALLYLTWYQPRQINLALAAVARYPQAPRPIHVIDVGCGALATTIAMAIWAASSEARRSDIDIEVHGIDPSDDMTRIGLRLLRRFSSIVASEPSLSRLRMTLGRVEENMGIHRTLDEYYSSDSAKRGMRRGSTCWLTVIHAVYASNVDSLREDLKRIRHKSSPAYEVVTCHKIGREVAERIRRRDAIEFPLSRENFDLHGYLNKTTDWRRQLASKLPTVDSILRPYLQPGVPWNPGQDDMIFLYPPQGTR